jgi:nicotinamide-nucleotide amidase
MFSETQLSLGHTAIETARAADLMIATAESCTGGLIGALLTEVPGSSAVFDRGVVTYSNDAKRDLLGVSSEDLERFGAVSEEVARAMALGAAKNSSASYTISVTGIAGPGGGTDQKPVGTVHIAIGASIGIFPKVLEHRRYDFGDIGRTQIRAATVERSLEMLIRVMHSVL